MTLTEKKKMALQRIESARRNINTYLQNGVITEEDIFSLLRVKNDFGFIYPNKTQTCKTALLRSIFNSPFILCDQDYLSLNIKQLLPVILKCRYDMEIDELKYQLENGLIIQKEYIEEEKFINFCYYGSSIDGKNILKKGHVDNLLDSQIKTR